jgi:hypothetical protein
MEVFRRIRLHLRLLVPLNLDGIWPRVVQSGKFGLEVLVCCGHVPPFVTFEVGLDNWSNFVLYRAETIGAVYATLRVYVVWMVLRDWCDHWHIST